MKDIVISELCKIEERAWSLLENQYCIQRADVAAQSDIRKRVTCVSKAVALGLRWEPDHISSNAVDKLPAIVFYAFHSITECKSCAEEWKDGREAIRYLVKAGEAIALAGMAENFEAHIAEYLPALVAIHRPGLLAEHQSKMAKKGAKARIERDPKTKQKILVRECWDAWQKRPESYRGKAEFARDMREKYEHLTSTPVIERWCREWEKDSPCR
jgi:hypothetical protein